jgi:hypothetical protein
MAVAAGSIGTKSTGLLNLAIGRRTLIFTMLATSITGATTLIE